jgi:hypothetical protein
MLFELGDPVDVDVDAIGFGGAVFRRPVELTDGEPHDDLRRRGGARREARKRLAADVLHPAVAAGGVDAGAGEQRGPTWAAIAKAGITFRARLAKRGYLSASSFASQTMDRLALIRPIIPVRPRAYGVRHGLVLRIRHNSHQ